MGKNGSFRKIVVVITDGGSDVSTNEVISLAQQDNICVYSIVVKNKASKELKRIADRSGAKCFEYVTEKSNLNAIAMAIIYGSEDLNLSEVNWRAETCRNRNLNNVTFSVRQYSGKTEYNIPSKKITTLEMEPRTAAFGKVAPKTTREMVVSLVAHNDLIKIDKITNTNNTLFQIKCNVALPYIIQPNKSLELKITFTPVDSGFVFSQIEAQNSCRNYHFFVSGGYYGKTSAIQLEKGLNIVTPNGGETYVAGIDTLLKWTGANKNDTVRLEFSNDKGNTWSPLKLKATDLKENWNVYGARGNNNLIKASLIQSRCVSLVNTLAREKFMMMTPVGNLITLGSKNVYMRRPFTGIEIANVPRKIGGAKISKFAFNPDNSIAIAIGKKKKSFAMNFSNGQILYKLKHKKALKTLFFNNDGSLILTACKDKAAYLWDAKTGNLVRTITDKETTIAKAYFSPDNKQVLTMGKQVAVWDAATGNLLYYLKGKNAMYSPSGSKILTYSFTPDIYVYDASTGKQQFRIKGLIDPNVSSVFANDDSKIVTVNVDTVRVWNGDNGALLYTIKGVKNAQTDAIISPSGTKLLTISREEAKIWNALSGKQLAVKGDKRSSIVKGIFNDDDKLLTINTDKIIKIWDTDSDSLLFSLPNFDPTTSSARFNSDGRSIIADDGLGVQLWELNNEMTIQSDISDNVFSIVGYKPVAKDVDLGSEYLGFTKDLIVNDFITNANTLPVSIKNIKIEGNAASDFSIVDGKAPYVVGANGKKNIEFRFTPTAEGERKANLLVCTATDTLRYTLKATALPRKFEMPTTFVDYGKLLVNKDKEMTFLIVKNLSKEPFTISDIQNIGPDKEQFEFKLPAKGFIVKAGETEQLKVKFKPRKRGKTNGNLKVHIKELNTDQIIQLYGDGYAPKIVKYTGLVLDSRNNQPIAGAVLSLYDLNTNRFIKSATSNKEGKYIINVPVDRNYSLITNKDKYLEESENIDLTVVILEELKEENIMLSMFVVGSTVPLRNVFFESGKSDLKPESDAEITRIAELLKKRTTVEMEISGHTDNVGDNATNDKLSMERADVVRNALIAKGIDGKRLKSRGFGATKPITKNDTDENKKRNRRVEFTILKI